MTPDDRAYLVAERAAIMAESGVPDVDERARTDIARLPTASTDDGQELDTVAMGVIVLRRFLGVADDEPMELCVVLPGKRSPHVAYPTTIDEHVRLARLGQRVRNGTGVYCVANRIHPDITARYPKNAWEMAFGGRAADHEITHVRALYIDCDAKRIKGISSTAAEKACALELMRRVRGYLVGALGDDHAIAECDTGNGYALLLALVPQPPTKDTATRLERFLKALNARFQVPGAEIDTTTFNAARLVPAFGTLKTKGANRTDRPHRLTHLTCRPLSVRRIPIEAL